MCAAKTVPFETVNICAKQLGSKVTPYHFQGSCRGAPESFQIFMPFLQLYYRSLPGQPLRVLHLILSYFIQDNKLRISVLKSPLWEINQQQWHRTNKKNWNFTATSPLWKATLLSCPGLSSFLSSFCKMNSMIWFSYHQFLGKHPDMLQCLSQDNTTMIKNTFRLKLFPKHKARTVIVQNIVWIEYGFNDQENPSLTDITHLLPENGSLISALVPVMR